MSDKYVPVGERHVFDHDLGPWHDAVEALAAILGETAIARDKAGGTALAERGAIRDSGLLTLRLPDAAGAPREAWPRILRIVRRLAAVDSSLAHLLAFQHLQVETLTLFGTPAQQQQFYALTQQGWFWGNATNDRDIRLNLIQDGGRYYLDGERMFCSGSADSDGLIINVAHPALPAPAYLSHWPPGSPALRWQMTGMPSDSVRPTAAPCASIRYWSKSRRF